MAEYQSSVDGYNITNTYTPGKISIPVRKVWEDDSNRDGIRPDEITVSLLADGTDTGEMIVLNSNNQWAGSFNDLDEYSGGTKIVYTLSETAVSGYSSSIEGSTESGFVITNSHTVERTEVSGTKTWNDSDNQDGKRPGSITVNLYANGVIANSKTVTADDDWTWEFSNLYKYSDGELITYTIDEDPVAEYQSSVDGYDITNTYTPGKVSIPVRKIWDDDSDRDGIRPEKIEIELIVNDESTDRTITLDADCNWRGSFDDLDEYENGDLISYAVREEDTDGYSVIIEGNAADGYTVTNTHKPEMIGFTGSKTWVDSDDRAGKRPDSIIVNLYADGVITDSKTVTADDGWSWEFNDLYKYSGGELITYTIDEEPVPEYQSNVDGYNITNTY